MNLKLKFHFALWMFILIFSAENCWSQNLQWAHGLSNSTPVGGETEGRCIKTDASGNSYVAGTFQVRANFDPGAGIVEYSSAGWDDIFFAKYDASGNYVYAKTIGGKSNERVHSISVDAGGNMFITGSFMDTVDFDPDAGAAILISSGLYDIFFAKYNSSGGLIYAKSIGSSLADEGIAIGLDPGGNVYLSGYFQGTADFDPGAGISNLTSAGGSDIFFAKYDASGNYIYAKSIGGTTNDQATSIFIYNANVYLTGKFSGTADFDPNAGIVNLISAGLEDIFFARYSISGNYAYAKSIGGSGSDHSGSITLDATGAIYLAGRYTGLVDFDPGAGIVNLSSIGTNDPFFAKYDNLGNLLFAKGLEGTMTAEITAISVDAGNAIYIAGYFSDSADFEPGPGLSNLISTGVTDIYFAKYDVAGNLIYVKGIGDASWQQSDAMTLDAAGNIFITGFVTGLVDFDPGAGVTNLQSENFHNCFFAKYSNSGLMGWAKLIGKFLGNCYDSGSDIALDAAGNSYVCGNFSGTVDFDPGPATHYLTSAGTYLTGGQTSDIFFAKYGAAGNLIYANRIGGNYDGERALSIDVDASGNCYITGHFGGTVDFDPGIPVANLNGSGNMDVFFAKYDASGNYVYAKKIGGTGDDIGYAIAVDLSGSVYLTGSFQYTVDFDPGAGTYNLSSNGNKDIFYAKYDASGNRVYSHKIGSTNDDEGFALDIDASGNVYVCGSFMGTVDFNWDAGTFNLSASTGQAVFFAKFNTLGNFVYARKIENGANPSIAADAGGAVYLTGCFSGTDDFDPGAGIVNLTSVNSYADIFIAKYNASGNYVYAKCIGGTSSDISNCIAVDVMGNVHITGMFQGTADFNPGAAINNLSSNGSNDIFFAKYDVSGNYMYARSMGSTAWDFGSAIASDALGNLSITGIFRDAVDFDPGPGTAFGTAINESDFFVARFDGFAPLPVELLSFSAETEGDFVNCSWITASESDNDFFTVQRSRDGIHFENAGEVKGAGNSSSTVSYQFTDTRPYSGISYYRLQQTDFNGSTALSDVVSVKFGEPEGEFKVFPNPSSGVVNFVLPEEKTDDSKIRLRDLSGKLIFEQVFTNTGGLHTLDLSDFQAGFYLVEIVREGESVFRKIQLVP